MSLTKEEQQLMHPKEMYLDEKDFLAEFLFNPDINEGADYKHIDKNLAITRLASKYKEPERARIILQRLHILNNPKYFNFVEETVFDGYEDKQSLFQECTQCGKRHLSEHGLKDCSDCNYTLPEPSTVVHKVPLFVTKRTYKSKYPKTYHKLKSMFYSLTTTSAARDGHLFRESKSNYFNRTDSIEDRTEKKSNYMPNSFKRN